MCVWFGVPSHVCTVKRGIPTHKRIIADKLDTCCQITNAIRAKAERNTTHDIGHPILGQPRLNVTLHMI